MENILTLLRRNVVLIKRYIIIFLLYSLVLPVMYIQVLKPEQEIVFWMAGFIQLFIMSIVINNTIEIAEENNKRVVELLCSAPYSRKQLVLTSYIFDLCIFSMFWLLIIVESIIMRNNFLHLNILGIGVVLMICNLYRGVMLPFQFKYGYSKTKNIFALLSFLLIFGIPVLTKIVDMNRIFIKCMQWKIFKIAYWQQCSIIYVIAIGATLLSYYFSIKVYEKKDFN